MEEGSTRGASSTAAMWSPVVGTRDVRRREEFRHGTASPAAEKGKSAEVGKNVHVRGFRDAMRTVGDTPTETTADTRSDWPSLVAAIRHNDEPTQVVLYLELDSTWCSILITARFASTRDFDPVSASV